MSKLLINLLRSAGLYNRSTHAQHPISAFDAAFRRADWNEIAHSEWAMMRAEQLINLGIICNAGDWGQMAGYLRKD